MTHRRERAEVRGCEAEPFFVLDSGPGDSALNMALDEALLEAAGRIDRPVLRFYGWLRPTASFGYFQKYAEVERLTAIRPLVRRPTGGGVVPHENDWTYSLVFPNRHPWYGLKAIESYRRVHDWIARSLALLGITVLLAPAPAKGGAGQCFSGWEQFDLLGEGRKIAGAAQRRSRGGLLIQGSLQPTPRSVSRAEWEAAMRRSFGPGKPEWRPLVPDTALMRRAVELAETKYRRDEYNRKK